MCVYAAVEVATGSAVRVTWSPARTTLFPLESLWYSEEAW